MSKVYITSKDIGRTFITQHLEYRTITSVDESISNTEDLAVCTSGGEYTRSGQWSDCGEKTVNDFFHWAKDRTPEWWATFNAVLSAVIIRHAAYTEYENLVATATKITYEAHK
jgi:hypothetical protein